MSSAKIPIKVSTRIGGTQRIPLVVIIGPTAVGKTSISIQLAERFNGEIVSADSRLFYRGMDIGTAKPSLQDRMRIPHHLIDVADPDEIWSLALFQREANRAIHMINDENHLPIMVGGTGQFVRAIIEGWRIPAVKPNPRLRDALTRWEKKIGPHELHSKLNLLDPHAASSIDPTNVRRVVRAMEVILSTGRLFSEQRYSGNKLYETLILGITRPRPELYQLIDNRINEMIHRGFVEEVRQLLDQGYAPDLPTLSAIGYSEMVAYIQGKMTLEEAITLIQRRTRIFVRRQANWFKESDPEIHWFNVSNDTVEAMGKLIAEWQGSIASPRVRQD